MGRAWLLGSLLGFGTVLIFLIPLMWTRWFLSGAELRSRRGLITLAVCLLWVVAGIGVFAVLS